MEEMELDAATQLVLAVALAACVAAAATTSPSQKPVETKSKDVVADKHASQTPTPTVEVSTVAENGSAAKSSEPAQPLLS